MKFSKRFICATKEYCTLTEFVPAPYLRKAIEIEAPLTSAALTVCGLGFYRLFVDGKELTKGLLSPYISNPDDILDYDAYDLTALLTPGKHVLGFQLGNGMQNAFGGYVWDFERAPWRAAPKLAICLTLTDESGKVTEIEADESFRTAPSPIRYDDLRQGEIYDANCEIPNWCEIDFDDSDWAPAMKAEMPRGRAHLCAANPIIETKRLAPKSITHGVTLRHARQSHVDTGVLYDFGENLAGLPLLKIKGEKGQKIRMIFGEYVKKDGSIDTDNIRFVRTEYDHFPLYLQIDEYICKGEGEETYSPSFTYHGFRYCLVCGLSEDQATPELLTYLVMNTDLKERGGFSCSDEVLNALQTMTRNSTLANFYHFPTDCPHREKNGWTADAALSTEHTLLNLEPENNYYEWMRHIRAAMSDDGALPGIIPTGGSFHNNAWGFAWGNGPAWDQILVTLPYLVYRYRGRTDIVTESLPALMRYVNYLTTRVDDRHLLAIGLGDWCAPYGARSPLIFTDSVISMDICRKAAFLHEVMGKKEQADFCNSVADRFRTAIRTHLIDHETMTAIGEGTPTPGCETSQAMALYYGIFDEEEIPAAHQVLLNKIHEQNDHLDTGVLGARVIFRVLSAHGDSDLAYEIMTKEDFPSYGNLVKCGFTALTESLGSGAAYENNSGIDSINHHFWGDISGWFISCICGITVNPTARDPHHIDIAPKFLSALSHASAHHIGVDGRIEVKWERTGADTLTLTVTTPEGAHGEIRFDEGWVCAKCNGRKTVLKSGTYLLKRV